MGAFEYIFKGEIVFALDVVLIDVVVFVGDSGDTDALGVAFLVDNEAG
jgi:hypothetical protein